MTDIFAVGDRVKVQFMAEDDDPPWIPGTVSAVNENSAGFWYEVDAGDGRELWAVPKLLERIDVDPEAPTDDSAVPTGMEGPSTDDSGSTGTAAEPATEEPSVPTLEDLAAQVATLTRRVEFTEGLLQFQTTLNREVGYSFEALHNQIAEIQPRVDGTFRHLDGAPRTTKRLHTKIVKNTKGYGFELSAEVTSDDPTSDVNALTATLMDQADLDAREQIKHAEYRDQYGLPGDDEVTTF